MEAKFCTAERGQGAPRGPGEAIRQGSGDARGSSFLDIGRIARVQCELKIYWHGYTVEHACIMQDGH